MEGLHCRHGLQILQARKPADIASSFEAKKTLWEE